MSQIPPKDAILEPLQMQDRVDHPKFGLGTIAAPPEGDKYEVLFDNPEFGTKRIVRRFLFLVTRPDAKGGLFWAHEYAKVLDKVLYDRARTDGLMKAAFRDANDIPANAKSIREHLDREKASIEALLEFLDADEDGDHT